MEGGKKEGKEQEREGGREGERRERKGRKGDDLTCRANSKFTYLTCFPKEKGRQNTLPPLLSPISGRGRPRLLLCGGGCGSRVPLDSASLPLLLRGPMTEDLLILCPLLPMGTISSSMGTQPCGPCDPHAPVGLYFPLDLRSERMGPHLRHYFLSYSA